MSNEPPADEPKLIIDEDWKTQVRREKERLKRSVNRLISRRRLLKHHQPTSPRRAARPPVASTASGLL